MTNVIIILALLISPMAIEFMYSKATGRPTSVRRSACWGLGIAFLFFALGHFVKTQGMVDMLPAWVPARELLIYLTGMLELIIGIGLFIPRFQTTAAMLALAVFVLFFPANIYAAMNGVGLGGHQSGPAYLLIRGPLQLVLIGWAYYLCIREKQ
ncbi:hypothetical protein GCM10008090_12670 [Arenicella chitinivorans]|uniref:DoxX family protein n=1 Tax=Arenicella chitinivorans TaxID=1329800 RepID=A0A918VKW1_9GAMM|nr:hypothetical protein [Arenicella chitinivorans]GHA04711.1 hypothetical protein GCM10008090_12670 [Arenicella chitinivorans]